MNILYDFLQSLKSPTILDRNPNLTLCSNHKKDFYVSKGRYWNSYQKGQAVKDGKGWYK